MTENRDILTLLRWRLAGLKAYYGFVPKRVQLTSEEFKSFTKAVFISPKRLKCGIIFDGVEFRRNGAT